MSGTFGTSTFGSGTFGDPAPSFMGIIGTYGQRERSGSESGIQRGATPQLSDGEVRPVAPWPNEAIPAGYGLWSDPNQAEVVYSPFVLDSADESSFVLESSDDTTDDATFVLLEGS